MEGRETEMQDWPTLIWIIATFLIAGSVKGVIGMGLPLIALGLLTAVTGLHAAMALMLAPAFITNVWQALAGGQTRPVLARIWLFLLASTGSIWLGAMALTRVDVRLLSGLLGLLLALYGLMGLLRPPLRVSPERETITGIAAGVVNGVLAGMTGSFSIPGVPWLQAIGLTRDQLIQAMGMLFSLSTLALAVGLGSQNLLSFELGLTSLAATVPALAGMVIGKTIRTRLSERQFRLVFFISLIILGVYIVARLLMK
jgi:uncharacterized membrane protein YfcA